MSSFLGFVNASLTCSMALELMKAIATPLIKATNSKPLIMPLTKNTMPTIIIRTIIVHFRKPLIVLINFSIQYLRYYYIINSDSEDSNE